MRPLAAALLSLLLLTACNSAQTRTNTAPLKTVAEIPLPGRAVRFDYLSFDAVNSRLYIAHMNDDHLIVFDARQDKVLANLAGFSNVHGVLAVPQVDRVFASITGEHALAIVEASTLKTLAKSGGMKYPDGVAYEPKTQRVFVSDEHGDADVVFDAQTAKLLKSIPLGGGAGNTVYDAVSGQILVAVHDRNELVAIDPVRLEIVARYPLPGIKEAHGIVLDAANRLAFIAGAGNARLALFDLTTHAVLGTYPVGGDPDVLAFDPGLRVVYVAAESGEVWMYRETGKALTALGSFALPHAHTICVDPATHRVYLPLQSVDGKPVLRIMEPDRSALSH